MGKLNLIDMFKRLLSYIYPNKCIFCRNIISNDKNICDKCDSHIRRKSKMTKIYIKDFPLTLCISAFKYDGYTKSAIWRFKFRNMKNYSNYFSEEIYSLINRYFQNINFSYVTCVPLHKSKLKERGYNQSELIARSLSKKLNIEFIPILIKNKRNLSQHKLSFSEREKNIRGVYSINPNINIDKNKNLLIFDDIITTGNTLKECVRILRKNDFNNIYCVTLAYV